MQTMSIAQLEDAIDGHGPDLGRWPVALRERAVTLIANSSQARRSMESAVRLDKALRAPVGVKTQADLAERITGAAFQKHRPGNSYRHPK